MEVGERQFSESTSGLTWTPRPTVDSFVVGPNKSVESDGSGEAKLFLGAKGSDADAFFGPELTALEFHLSKANLLQLLHHLEPLYRTCYADYRGGRGLVHLWEERREHLDRLPEDIIFTAIRKPYAAGESRAYLSSEDPNWRLLRELPLSRSAVIRISRPTPRLVFNMSVVSAVPLDRDALVAAEALERYGVSHEHGGHDALGTVVEQIAKARRGQQTFKKNVLRRMASCPFTGISDIPLLRASHIKPWRHSTDYERLDAKNGLTLSPMYDVLFDGGFISFDRSGALLVSSHLSSETVDILELSPGLQVLSDEIAAESALYLDHHRAVEFLRP